ncbi:MAG: TIGR03960 family B12-binding radical SAM protein [Lachnospiraceae bacterium]|nr:TIGR03960 family B12-binding radical SAM protein [Lachnospiraceae bacterium]
MNALSDRILLKIEKPARYIGHEVNAIYKDPNSVDIRFCMCFPDVYEIGMSHLGIQILYDMLNKRDDTWCERVYSPWTDLHEIMKAEDIPLFALESQDKVKDFDFLGITLQYEMCYTNVLQILDLSKIPMMAKDRDETDPIVIGGGPCSYNPEPIADFFDLFYMGEGEISYPELLDLYKECKSKGLSRKEFIHEASKIEGIYAPSMYEVQYNDDFTIKSFTAKYEDVPSTVRKTAVSDMSNSCYPDKPLVPYIKATQDRVVLEIQRGCIRGCRFCQAGMIYRPVREKNLEVLKEKAVNMLESTGHEEICLSSLSSSDYTNIQELLEFLIEYTKKKHVNISLPSLRIDSFSLDVMGKVQDVKKSSLTFAPEAGSQRLRDVINKGLTEEVILNGAKLAFLGGWNKVKLYFMLGHPTETEEDMRGIAELSNEIAKLYYELIPKEKRIGKKVQITASTSFFVPKPFTPFQWARQSTKEEFLDKAHTVMGAMKEQINFKSIKYNWHDNDLSVLEGLFARGDRRLSAVLLKAYEKGCIFDSWTDCFKGETWEEVLEECNVDLNFYTHRERSIDEILPWDFIDTGVTKAFLINEWKKAHEATVTKNCKMQCSGCGALRYGKNADGQCVAFAGGNL